MHKVLFITVDFYEYIEAIKKVIEKELDAKVDTLVLNKASTVIDGGLNYITGGEYIKNKEINRQREWFSKQLEVKYDYIFMIVGRNLDIEGFCAFISEQKEAKKILYLWDDAARIDNIDEKEKLFDRIVSFDKSDCDKYGFEFIPLFYLEEYRYDNEPKDIDILFAGSSHSGRLEFVERLFDNSSINEYKWFIKFVVSKPRLIANMLRLHNRKISKYLTSKNMSVAESSQLLKRSRVDIDIPHLGQNGLSIRMAEALASHTKVVTTNPEVLNYSFYNADNILVINTKSSFIPDEFIKTSYVEVDPELVELYSVNTWVKAVFGLIDNPHYSLYSNKRGTGYDL